MKTFIPVLVLLVSGCSAFNTFDDYTYEDAEVDGGVDHDTGTVQAGSDGKPDSGSGGVGGTLPDDAMAGMGGTDAVVVDPPLAWCDSCDPSNDTCGDGLSCMNIGGANLCVQPCTVKVFLGYVGPPCTGDLATCLMLTTTGEAHVFGTVLDGVCASQNLIRLNQADPRELDQPKFRAACEAL